MQMDGKPIHSCELLIQITFKLFIFMDKMIWNDAFPSSDGMRHIANRHDEDDCQNTHVG